MLTAERAILLELESLCSILLILICLIISSLALFTSECELISDISLSHILAPPFFYTIKKDLAAFLLDNCITAYLLVSTRNNLFFKLRFDHVYGAREAQQHDNTNYTLKAPSRKSAYAYKLIIDIKEYELK